MHIRTPSCSQQVNSLTSKRWKLTTWYFLFDSFKKNQRKFKEAPSHQRHGIIYIFLGFIFKLIAVVVSACLCMRASVFASLFASAFVEPQSFILSQNGESHSYKPRRALLQLISCTPTMMILKNFKASYSLGNSWRTLWAGWGLDCDWVWYFFEIHWLLWRLYHSVRTPNVVLRFS